MSVSGLQFMFPCSLCTYSLFEVFYFYTALYVFYPLQLPPQSSAASHTDQYRTCPHPNVSSVFIIDLLKCLYLCPLCVGAHLSKVSYILSTSTRDTTVCCSSITQEQKHLSTSVSKQNDLEQLSRIMKSWRNPIQWIRTGKNS